MKNKFMWLWAILAMSIAVCTTSCKDDEPGEGPGPGPNNKTDLPRQAYPSQPTAATSEGVDLEALVEETDFVATFTPREDCVSYTFAVLPCATVYNAWMELQKTQPDATLADWMRDFMVRPGAGWYNIPSTGEAVSIRWSEKYKTGYIHPDCDYFLIGMGCAGADGALPTNDITYLNIQTPKIDMVGTPECPFTMVGDYTRVRADFTPNEDCAYFYYFATDKWQSDELVAWCKERGYEFKRMLRDITLNFQNAPTATSAQYDPNFNESYLSYTISFGPNSGSEDPDKVTTIYGCVVPMDANKTPAGYIYEQECSMVVIPPSEPAPITATVKSVSAYTANVYYDLDVDPDNKALQFKYVCVPTSLYKSDSAKGEYKTDKFFNSLYTGGYGVGRDSTGKVVRNDKWEWPLEPATDYTIVGMSLNYFSKYSEITGRCNFTTLPVSYEGSTASVNLSIKKVSKDGVVVSAVCNEDTRVVWWQIYDKDSMDVYFADDEAIRNNLMNVGSVYLGYVGQRADNTDGLSGLYSGHTYFACYVLEDKEGRISDVFKCEATTLLNEGGNSPEVTITDRGINAKGEWAVYFEINSDVTSHKCAVVEDQYRAGLDRGDYSLEEYEQQWADDIQSVGIPSINSIERVGKIRAGKDYIAADYCWGKVTNGVAVQGGLKYISNLAKDRK